MKRRKNSWISSSSMPGTCGSVLRRTACVVLMFTTAFPCSSTRRVKSGRTWVWARATAQNAASQRPATALTTRIASLLKMCSLLRTVVFDRIGDALHARGGRLAHYGDHVVCHLASIDVDRSHARESGSGAAPVEGLDEHGNGRETVRVHHLAHRLGFAHATLELHDLLEARQLGAQAPASQARGRRRGILDAPGAGASVTRAHHLARHVDQRELREHKLLHVPAGIEGHGLEQHPGRLVRVQTVAVAEVVLR